MATNDIIAAKLDMIAAKAKAMATSYRTGRLWDGELTSGINEIDRTVDEIRHEYKIALSPRSQWI